MNDRAIVYLSLCVSALAMLSFSECGDTGIYCLPDGQTGVVVRGREITSGYIPASITGTWRVSDHEEIPEVAPCPTCDGEDDRRLIWPDSALQYRGHIYRERRRVLP